MLKEIDKTRKSLRKVEDEQHKTLKKKIEMGKLNINDLMAHQKRDLEKKELKKKLNELENHPKVARILVIRDAAAEVLTSKGRGFENVGFGIKKSHFKDLHNIDSISEGKLLKLAKKYDWLVDVNKRKLKNERVIKLLQMYHGVV
jgi:hypothetical protein